MKRCARSDSGALSPIARIGASLLALTLSVPGIVNQALSQPDASEPCSARPLTVDCLLLEASGILSSLDADAFDWSTAAAELAIAYDANDQSSTAQQLITRATNRAFSLPLSENRAKAFGDIAQVVASMSSWEGGLALLESMDDGTRDIADVNKRADVLGKLIVASATQGDPMLAFERARQMPSSEGNQGDYRALTLRKVAARLAKAQRPENAAVAARAIDTGIDYYKSIARSDVAIEAAKQGRDGEAIALLKEAAQVATTIDNGYFKAASFRDIAVAYHFLGNAAQRDKAFVLAVDAAKTAKRPNEQARSMSRIATRMADIDQLQGTEDVIRRSITLGEAIESDGFRAFADYEITGAAAFSAQFTLASQVLRGIPDVPLASTKSVLSAAQRDLAWGLARHGRLAEAIELARKIRAARERVQALSRIVRVLIEPRMEALPRYL